MSDKIKELINKIIENDTEITGLLQRAMLIAIEYNEHDFVSWIKLELNGYNNNECIPEYRRIKGRILMSSPEAIGWYSHNIDNIELQEEASTRFMHGSLDELSNIIISAQMDARDFIKIGYSRQMEETLLKTLENVDRVIFSCEISRIKIIFEKVKNGLLEKLADLERSIKVTPSDEMLGNIFPHNIMSKLSNETKEQITKCRRKIVDKDYSGAITNSRSLVESVVKDIYQKDAGQDIESKGKLASDWTKFITKLNLHPEKAPNEDLRKVLSGLISTVQGLASARNNLSDGHSREYKPEAHHAILLVNSALTITAFLYGTQEHQQKLKQKKKLP